jgi:lysophospholipase L1-like esterase
MSSDLLSCGKSTKLSRAALVFFVSLVGACGAHAEPHFALRDGDRVIFYGDSITEPRLYTSFVETFAITRFPSYQMQFRNSAWGGDRVNGGRGGPIDVRLQRDVIAYRPTVFALLLGINDGWGVQYDARLYDRFTAGYEHIVRVLTDALPGLRITLMQPSPYDEVTRAPAFGGGGYNGVMIRYGEFVKDFGHHVGFTVAELNAPFISVLVAAEAQDHSLAKQIAGDGTHPGIAGHLILAEALLKAWNAPELVSSLEIDTDSRHVANAENTIVSDLRVGNSVSWTQLDNALPFPLDVSDPAIALALRCSDFVQALDQEKLKITGLQGEHYLLRIDGERVGIVGREQLQEGINLALLDTPMERQARKVHSLTIMRNEIQFGQWRQVQAALQHDWPPHKRAALDVLDEVQRDLLEQQHAAAAPLMHHFELQPQ